MHIPDHPAFGYDHLIKYLLGEKDVGRLLLNLDAKAIRVWRNYSSSFKTTSLLNCSELIKYCLEKPYLEKFLPDSTNLDTVERGFYVKVKEKLKFVF